MISFSDCYSESPTHCSLHQLVVKLREVYPSSIIFAPLLAPKHYAWPLPLLSLGTQHTWNRSAGDRSLCTQGGDSFSAKDFSSSPARFIGPVNVTIHGMVTNGQCAPDNVSPWDVRSIQTKCKGCCRQSAKTAISTPSIGIYSTN